MHNVWLPFEMRWSPATNSCKHSQDHQPKALATTHPKLRVTDDLAAWPGEWRGFILWAFAKVWVASPDNITTQTALN